MNQKLFDFYARQYEGELDRKEKLRQASTLPVGLTAVVGGLVFYSFQIEKTVSFIPVISSILSILAVATLVGFFVLSAQFYIAVGYKWIPDADEWNTWHESLREHASRFENVEPPKVTFQKELVQTYIRCAGFNKVENDRKSGLLHQMHQTILTAIGIAATAAFLRLLHEHGASLYS
jgi:hypothetical protein